MEGMSKTYPCLPCSALHESHCPSDEFTGLAKLTPEKQTI